MERHEENGSKHIFRVCCAIILMIIATVMFFICWYGFVEINNVTGHLLGLGNLGMAVFIYAFLYIVIGRALRAFCIGKERVANIIASQVLTVFVVGILEVITSMLITGEIRFFGRFLLTYFILAIIQGAVLGIVSIPMVKIYRRVYPPLSMLTIYGDYENNLHDNLNSLVFKYHIAQAVSCRSPKEAIRSEIKKYDAILINDVPSHEKNMILKMCFELNKRVYFVPKISDILVKNSEELNLLDTPLYMSRNIGLTFYQKGIKRALDVFFSGLALIIFGPIMLVIMAAIKIDDGGPVFFKQERCSLNEKRFMILKFRSMIVDAEKDGKPHPAGEKDDRITRVGKVIRATRLDELPQLINILKGDMSIVGPRPERVEHVQMYTDEIPEFPYRSKVKGGLTGYAQVYGKYNTTALDKLKLDLIYITNYSLLLDFQILFETLKILFQKESTEGFTEEKITLINEISENNTQLEKTL